MMLLTQPPIVHRTLFEWGKGEEMVVEVEDRFVSIYGT
jgi:hypothetical protein